MVPLLVEVGVAPILAAASTLVARRFGARAGGLASAFPAIAGPLLLVTALEHGSAFAARAANGTLLGLVALSGFAVAYGRLAPARPWPLSFAAGWSGAAASAALAGLGAGSAPPAVGLAVAALSLVAAERRLAKRPAGPLPAVGHSAAAIPVRMAATALLVILLAAAATALGPLVGGMLAALPVLASVLTVCSHREAGGAAAVAWLRGTLRGMASFVAFCEVFALVIGRAGVGPAVATATLAALAAQAAAARPPGILQQSVYETP